MKKTKPKKYMKKKTIFLFKFRTKVANILVRLAFKIRPKEVSDYMRSMEDEIKYGNGVMRIRPDEFYKVKKQNEKN